MVQACLALCTIYYVHTRVTVYFRHSQSQIIILDVWGHRAQQFHGLNFEYIKRRECHKGEPGYKAYAAVCERLKLVSRRGHGPQILLVIIGLVLEQT